MKPAKTTFTIVHEAADQSTLIVSAQTDLQGFPPAPRDASVLDGLLLAQSGSS